MFRKIFYQSVVILLLFLGSVAQLKSQSLTVNIIGSTNGQPLAPANAGADMAQSASTFIMAATVPTIGIGGWSIISGSAIITDASSATTTVTNVPVGETILRWTVTLGSCTQSDDVKLKVDPALSITLDLKVFLEGPYDNSTHKMKDDLRTQNLITLSYGQETTTPSVLNVSSDNAIIDWLTIELRDAAQPINILYKRNALLQADGDVVDIDGISPVNFTQTITGNYYICIKHSNHLKFRTLNAISLSQGVNSFNFSDNSIPLFGTNPLKTIESGVFGMYGGDFDGNGIIDANDRSAVWNNRNFIGYSVYDTNLDGKVDATDRSNVWNNRNLSAGFQ